MAVNERGSGLLEAIRVEAGLDYLSDVHYKQFRERVQAAIGRIPSERFDLEEWRVAAAYILGVEVDAGSALEIRERLGSHL